MKKNFILYILLTNLFGQSFTDLTERPTYNPQKITSSIILDGTLDEQVWLSAQVATNFIGTGLFQGESAPLNTEAKLLYDDTHLYVGFVAYIDREDLRFSITQRDNLDDRDDRVWINIDAFDDESLTYVIGVSAGGAQIDGRATYNVDQSLDLIYETEVKIYEDRYEVEMAIPFTSLRYSLTSTQTWRINFGRGFTGNDEFTRYVYWASKVDGIECQTCQLGFLNDIQPPKQERGDIEYIPSLVGGYSEDFTTNTSNSNDDVSMFIKYPISSVDLLEIAFNPDFSQIESDDVQNDLNTVNALFFREKRPFFSEGAELFQFSPQRGFINLFYSRTINDPSIVGKYTGKVGKTSYGVISARDESSPLLLPFEETSTVVSMGKSSSNIVRVKRMLKNGGSIGGIVTNRVFDNAGDMTTGGIDFHYHPGNNLHLTLHGTASVHNESSNLEYNPDSEELGMLDDRTSAFDGERISGNALGFSLNKMNRTDSMGFTVRLRSPGFRTSNGFEKNNSTKWAKLSRGKSIYYDNHPVLVKINFSIGTIYKTNYDNLVKYKEIEGGTNIDFADGSNMMIEFELSEENFKGVQFESAGFHTNYTRNLNQNTKFHGGIHFGDEIIRYFDIPEQGDGRGIYGYVEYKISDSSNFSLGLQYQDVEDYYHGQILQSRFNHSFSSKLTMRTKVQYSGFSDTWFIEPMVTYQPNAFSALYVGINDLLTSNDGMFSNLSESERQFFIKFQYLF
ncbi:MAG: carbohydrate binding family 9 domain-containing protein [Gammaproteobacteria bacterium]|nr:carbohydrate binding family 9 domain-containing protein [Gammaproteobacteria bacterium]MBL6911864.1 carbohydrate binding family 9 domain-containing protein [Candidatus Neomarinimicrobiota bacterium]